MASMLLLHHHGSLSEALPLMLLLLLTAGLTVTAQRAGGGGYREAPAVNVFRQGVVSGIEVPLNKIGQRVWMYLGIPFALPPIGDLRFRPPETNPPPSWTGIRNGSAHMPGCIPYPPPRQQQPVHQLFASVTVPPIGQVRTSEDCLYLNVYRPEGSAPEEKFPVMVWFHPGDFNWGAPAYWDASILAARHKVIVVTTAYRLNILGFFTSHSNFATGNWGLMDQAAALDWVQRNIDVFGGSARDVTVFGQGAGAVSVGLHLVSPWSRDKFQRAISMSGTALGRGVIDVPPSGGPPAAYSEERLTKLEDQFRCFRRTLRLCLRNVPAEEVVRFGGGMGWGPVVDGPILANVSRDPIPVDASDTVEIDTHDPFLPDVPAALMGEGRFSAVPHMVGYNRMEGAFDFVGRVQADGGAADGITTDRFEALVRDDVAADDEQQRQDRQQQQQQKQHPMMDTAPAAAAADPEAEEGATAGESSDDGGGGGGVMQAAGDENCTMDSDFVVGTVMMRYARYADDADALRRNYVTMATSKAYGAAAYRLAEYVARRNAAAYVYRYEYKLRAVKALPAVAEWMDAPHGAELPAVWGMPYWPGPAAAIDWTAADRRMTDVVMTLWTNFARHGDPAYRVGGVAMRWEEFQPRSPRAMVLDKVPNMSLPDQDPEFWNQYYPKVLAVALHCCPNIPVESAAGPARHGLPPTTLLLFFPLLLPSFMSLLRQSA